MLQSDQIVLTGAQITVHAHNSILHFLVKKLLSRASTFNPEKLLTIAACTTEKWKASANAQRPMPGVGDFFFRKESVYQRFANFFRG